MQHNAAILDACNSRTQQPFIKMKFKIRYLENDRAIHQVEVRNINYSDVKRHLEAGDMVEIIPEFTEQNAKDNNHDESPCYIPHI
jgi:hypothetical protein